MDRRQRHDSHVLTASPPEDIQLLYQFIERLDPLNKALVLLYLDGNNYGEIADVLGISRRTLSRKLKLYGMEAARQSA